MTNTAVDLLTETSLAGLLDEELSRARSSKRLGAKALPTDYGHLSAALYAPLRHFFAQPGKEFRARLVDVCWSLAGGAGPVPRELGCAVEALHSGSLIVDDIEDGSNTRRGRPALHVSHGVPVALNAGNWLYFWALSLIERGGFSVEAELALYRSITRTLSICHEGQALDLTLNMGRLSQNQVPRMVEATTRMKTGALLGLAAILPALAAGAPDGHARALQDFGENMGVALQMLDDLGGLTSERRAHKGHEDLRLGRPTWPWAWLAAQLPEMEYARLQQRAREVETGYLHPESLARELRELLGPVARRRVSAHLDRSFDELPPTVRTHSSAVELSRELSRLVASYE